MTFNPNRRADVFVTVESQHGTAPRTVPTPPSTTQRNFVHEFDRITALMRSEPRDTIFCLLMVLEVPRWFVGSWGDVDSNHKPIKDGWLNSRNGELVSFETAREWIAERIAELALDTDLVNAWPSSVHSIAEDSAFRSLPFAERMNVFRVCK